MIGRIRFDYHGHRTVATLGDDLRWECGHPLAGLVLANLCDAREDTGPASGQPGFRAFHEAVRIFRATILDAPTLPREPPGIIH
jgi:hypothetical protein